MLHYIKIEEKIAIRHSDNDLVQVHSLYMTLSIFFLADAKTFVGRKKNCLTIVFSRTTNNSIEIRTVFLLIRVKCADYCIHFALYKWL